MAVSAVTFKKEWSKQKIQEAILSCFPALDGKLDFEILVPTGGHLVKPTLLSDQKLDGNVLFSIFYQKPTMYIRPSSYLDVPMRKVINFLSAYSQVSLEDTGFKFGKCGRNKKQFLKLFRYLCHPSASSVHRSMMRVPLFLPYVV